MSTRSTGNEATVARQPITRAGYRRLQQELERLKGYERESIRARIRQARLYGDGPIDEVLVEVAERDLAALDRQIADLEAQLASVQVVEAPENPGAAALGSRVTVRHGDGTVEMLALVGPSEAAPPLGRISVESRAGRALVGARPGATVTVGSGPQAATLTVTAVAKAVVEEATPVLPPGPTGPTGSTLPVVP